MNEQLRKKTRKLEVIRDDLREMVSFLISISPLLEGELTFNQKAYLAKQYLNQSDYLSKLKGDFTEVENSLAEQEILKVWELYYDARLASRKLSQKLIPIYKRLGSQAPDLLFSTRLMEEDYRYFLTFNPGASLSRPVLESLIAEWTRRINRKFLGRNYYKDRFYNHRLQGIVWFETGLVGNGKHLLHAHALLKPMIFPNSGIKESDFLLRLEMQWGNCKKEFTERENKDSVCPKGDVLIEFNRKFSDFHHRNRYSGKQSGDLLKVNPSREKWVLPADLDCKFLSDLENKRLPTLKARNINHFKRIRKHSDYMHGPVTTVPVDQYLKEKTALNTYKA